MIDDIAKGEEAALTRTVTADDIAAFAVVSGDRNPIHLDAAYARHTPFGGTIAHGMLTAALVSSLLGNRLPGAGAVYVSQSLRFLAPVRPGDEVCARVAVTDIDPVRRLVTLATTAHVAGRCVLDGEAVLKLPRSRHPVSG